MQKRSSKQGPEDINEAAFRVFQSSIGETPSEEPPEKNPAAVALGRLGGLKGGKARSESMSAEERSDVARKAAQARWKAKDPDNAE